MYEYRKRIGFSECDTDRKLSVTSLIDAFQDCSTFQSEDLGVGFDVLQGEHLVWVINYWELEIGELPHLCDYVTVGTFPYGFKACFGLRNFYMKDEEGHFLVKANSMWTLIDSDDIRPVKAPDFLREAYVVEEKLDMSYSPRKVLIPADDGITVTAKDPVHIQVHHLDSNHHVNNGQYVKLALSQTGYEQVSHLRIDYRRQAKLGDVIYPVVYSGENDSYVALNDGEGNPFSVSRFVPANS